MRIFYRISSYVAEPYSGEVYNHHPHSANEVFYCAHPPLSKLRFGFSAIKKAPAFAEAGGCFSGPVGIRTPNLLIRSQMLYPIELRVRMS